MRRILLALVMVLAPVVAESATKYSRASGEWSTASSWSDTGCGGAASGAVPGSSNNVVLCDGVTITVACNATASAIDIKDDAGLISGGLIADATACAKGQAPKIALYGTADTAGIQMRYMGRQGTFRLRGRLVYSDLPWGVPSDLTDNCGGSDITVNGTTWESAKNECAKYTWASAPYAGKITAFNDGTTGLNVGDVVWLTTGQWRNNYLTVLAVTSNTITVGYGDPNDDMGTAGGFSPSLQAARDTDVTAWSTANPTRITATVKAGTLPNTGELQGSCLITDTADGGSGKAYRIAASIDGGAGTDTLIFDPWVTVDPADDAAGFKGAANNAWIAPCVLAGDRWMAYEPVTVYPATAGTNRSALALWNGACPDLQYSRWPNVTQIADTGTPPTADLDGAWLQMYGQSGCTISGPVAVGPLRSLSGSGDPYFVALKGTSSLTFDRFSIQGFYAVGGAGPVTGQVAHGFRFHDSQNLTIRRSNASYFNNEAFYLTEPAAETSESDEPFEGLSATFDEDNAHDLFEAAAETDGGTAFAFRAALNTTGSYDISVTNSLAFNVSPSFAQFTSAIGLDYTATAQGNVFGYAHRVSQADSASRTDVTCELGGANDLDAYVANNVFLTSVHYASTGYSFGTQKCKSVAYNYFGEHYTAISLGNGTLTGSSIVGNLIDGGGYASGNTSTMQIGVSYQRDTGQTGDQVVRDTTIRRQCGGPASSAQKGIYIGNTAGTTFKPMFSHNTIGMWCPEAAGTACGNGTCAGIYFPSTNNLADGSVMSHNVFNTGPSTDAAWKVVGILAYSGATGGVTSIDSNICTQCRNGANTCQSACNRNATGAAFSIGTNSRQLDSPVGRLGWYSDTDPRLMPGSIALSDASVVGARYSGIVHYSQAMLDAGIPIEWVIYRATSDRVPDATVLPPQLRWLVRGRHGSSGWTPKAF